MKAPPLLAHLVPRKPDPTEQRSSFQLNFQDYMDQYVNYNGVMYPFAGMTQTLAGEKQELGADYGGMVTGAVKSNPIVAACLLCRLLHFTEARFQFRYMRNGRPGPLFGSSLLKPIEQPWPNGTTRNLLARMIQDADLAGNSYFVAQGDRLARLRPDWVEIVLGSRTQRANWHPGDVDTEVAGYIYYPGGKTSGSNPSTFPVETVAHFAPIPDPSSAYKGMSILSAARQEIMADQSMTRHRQKFFEQGATVNLVVKLTPPKQEEFNEFVRKFREGHEGVTNAYKTLYVTPGTDVQPIGADMQQQDFRVVQGAGETRMALAMRVPPTLLHNSEGLAGSTLNQGNYQAARRQFADEVMRPMWATAAGALQTILQKPGGNAELWYDERDIAFLREDIFEIARTQQAQAGAALSLINAGWEPDAIVDFINSNDITQLMGNHTGLPSVQLQPDASSGGTSDSGSVNGKVPAQLGAG